MKTVIGIDLGTQNLKVVFYDFETARVVAVESSPLKLHQDETGIAEQQAQWWVDALHDAIARVDHKIRKSASAIAVSGQQHGFVPVDKSGKVLTAAKLWCDTSTTAQCQEIMDNYGGADKCLRELGNLILPGYTASKVLWFRQRYPALYQQMTAIMLPHDYLNFYLTGQHCMEAGDASGTGFLDVRGRKWSKEMLRAIDGDRDLADCLPEPCSEPRVIGTVEAHIATTLDLPAGLPVASGGGDNMMAAIGTGNVKTGKMTMSLGTSGTVYAFSDKPVIDPKGNIAAFCSSDGGWLPLLCTMNCTVSTELMRRMIDIDISDFEAQVERATPGAGGVVTLPFFNGERMPNLPNAKACVVGLDSSNTLPENLLRSAMEGATYSLRFGVDELSRLGIKASEIILTGGGANSPTWRQMVADVCEIPVTILQQNEGAAFGAALQALAALDPGKTIADLANEHVTSDATRCCLPRPGNVSFYRNAYGEYQDTVRTVTKLFE